MGRIQSGLRYCMAGEEGRGAIRELIAGTEESKALRKKIDLISRIKDVGIT
jgi:hypothetical protein